MTPPAKKSKKSATPDPNVDPLGDLFEGVDFEADDDFGSYGAWPTGMPIIDLLSGIGGFPKGRIVELSGQESSGKSTSAIMACARAQKEGKISFYLDYEGSFDKKWARTLGLDPDDKATFRVVRPVTLEDGFEWMMGALQHEEIGPNIALFVVDSVSTMPAQAEIDQGLRGQRPALKAMMLNRAQDQYMAVMRKLKDRQATLVYINQLFVDISFGGAPGQIKKITPGGRATKFGPSLRIQFQVIGQLKGKALDYKTGKLVEIKSGQKVRATAIKNKASGNAQMQVEYAVIFGIGFDNVYTMTDIALERKVIKARGAWYDVPGAYTSDGEEKAINGKDAMREHFYRNEGLYQKLENDMMGLISLRVDTETGEVTEPEVSDSLDLLMGDIEVVD